MLNIIRYIFETQQDIKLYYNQKRLVNDLIKQSFQINEIQEAIKWFYPIIDAGTHQNYFYQAKAIRSFDYWEYKYLSKNVLNSILEQEKAGVINSFLRDILIDRLWVIAQQEIDEQDIHYLLKCLVSHLQRYKFGLINQETKFIPTAWNANFTVH